MLYAKHAKVYIASRSREKAVKSIEDIKKRAPKSTGELLFLPLDLADLRTIKPFAEEFLRQENKLHVLFNNAGVMKPAPGSKTAQDYELQLGVNNIGPFLLTKLLTPALITTAKTEPANSVRVVWVSSSAADGASPKGGVPLDYLDYHDKKTPFYWYAVSKAGNYLHATEFTKLYRGDGIVSVPLNPGNLNSELYRTALAPVMGAIIRIVALHPPIFGAYTELFAGLSPVVTVEKSGDWGKHRTRPCAYLMWSSLQGANKSQLFLGEGL